MELTISLTSRTSISLNIADPAGPKQLPPRFQTESKSPERLPGQTSTSLPKWLYPVTKMTWDATEGTPCLPLSSCTTAMLPMRPVPFTEPEDTTMALNAHPLSCVRTVSLMSPALFLMSTSSTELRNTDKSQAKRL